METAHSKTLSFLCFVRLLCAIYDYMSHVFKQHIIGFYDLYFSMSVLCVLYLIPRAMC